MTVEERRERTGGGKLITSDGLTLSKLTGGWRCLVTCLVVPSGVLVRVAVSVYTLPVTAILPSAALHH